MDLDDAHRGRDAAPTAKELRGAARAATIMAYAVGLAGVAVGTLALREDDLPIAVLLYVVTFAVGACLIGVATIVRAIAAFTTRLDRIDRDLAGLARDRAAGELGPPGGDWRHGSPY